MKYAPYRSAPEFDFGHDENKGKHYCPADRPNYIRVRNECVDTNFCGSTAYNPRDESCCPLLGQHFNSNTNECESCPAAGSIPNSFNPSTQQCCPADTPFYLREVRAARKFSHEVSVKFSPEQQLKQRCAEPRLNIYFCQILDFTVNV